MTTFTIDNENNITAFGSPEEAAAATTTPFDTFASQQELAELADGLAGGALGSHLEQPGGRRPGQEVQERATRPSAGSGSVSRAWARPPSPPQNRRSRRPNRRPRVAHRRPRARRRRVRRPRRPPPPRTRPKPRKAAKAQETAGPREGSKTAQVVAMLQRKNGATLAEIMERWAGRDTPSAGSWPAR